MVPAQTQCFLQAGDHLQLSPTVKSDDKRSKPKATTKSKNVKEDKNGTKDEQDATTEKTEEVSSASKAAETKRLRPPSSLSFTLFDRLLHQHGNKVKRTLTIQYRMHEAIMQFPSSALYNNELTAAEGVKGRLLADLPNVDQDAEVCQEPVVFIDS